MLTSLAFALTLGFHSPVIDFDHVPAPAPVIVEALADAFKKLTAERTLALVLVDPHTEIALSLTEDAVVIERGRIVHRARSAELARDPAMAERVLGLSA